jgi:hypothetical protein
MYRAFCKVLMTFFFFGVAVGAYGALYTQGEMLFWSIVTIAGSGSIAIWAFLELRSTRRWPIRRSHR